MKQDASKAEALAEKIKAKVIDALDPIATEMKIMKWRPEFQAIMWEAVMMEAMARKHAAQQEAIGP